MTVREFDGTDDNMNHDIGGLTGWTFGTFAAIYKSAAAAGGNRWIAAFHNSGGTLRSGMITSGTERLGVYDGTDLSLSPTSFIAAGTWYLTVVRKATGSDIPRYSHYNFTSTTWTHADGSTALVNATAPGASGTIRTSAEASEFFTGRLAMRALWLNEAHWAADTGGDTAIEAAGLEDELQAWIDAAPTALWAFNQASTATACDDLVGTSDQTALVGTTAIEGDDPPGFTFALAEPPVPNLFVVRSPLQLR